MSSRSFPMRAAVLAAAVALGSFALPSQAHPNPSADLSAASGLSLSVPVAISVAAPSAVLVSGAVFTVVAVQALAEGTVWVLERASDGLRISVRFGSEAAGASVAVVGTTIVVTTVAAGCVLSAAGEAIAFIPNELGRALLHEERITR
ncbi:hypothetical protein [Ideonella sp. YS5]|uniref:hypothetical protein n=1 Tax=Ideonella sp. YS5 TaxID=3453714 RepID=UPI003EEE6185